jgi:hypothetical protein
MALDMFCGLQPRGTSFGHPCYTKIHRLRLFENRVLRGMFGSKGRRMRRIVL